MVAVAHMDAADHGINAPYGGLTDLVRELTGGKATEFGATDRFRSWHIRDFPANPEIVYERTRGPANAAGCPSYPAARVPVMDPGVLWTPGSAPAPVRC